MDSSDIRMIAIKSFKLEVPGVNEITLEDSFKKLNIDSLSRTMIIFRIEEELRADFSDLNLFQCDSLEEICQKIEKSDRR